MPAATQPPDETERLAALRALEILDSPPEAEFDAIVKLAADICGVPVALVSLIDAERQWFKARVGLAASETSRDVAFCAHALTDEATLVVPNAALDPRFADNPLRLGPAPVEFYAGVPLRTSAGHTLGTLCVIDHVPRSLSAAQLTALEALAAQVARLLDLRRATLMQRDTLASLRADDELLRRGEAASVPSVSSTWSKLAFALAAVLGLATVLAALWVRSTVTASSAARLAYAAERAEAFLEERAAAYGEILRGTGALLRASTHVAPAEFAVFMRALELDEHYPGVLGLGFAERVPREGLDAWLAAARLEVPTLELVTSGTHPDLVINKLVEPLAQNRAALGFDVASEPVRSAALAAAARTGEPALTGRVQLRQDPSHGPGFVMYLAVPRPDGSVAGWAFAALRARDLVSGVEAAAGAEVELRLVDDPGAPPLLGDDSAIGGGVADGAHVVDVAIADRVMRLEVRPGRSFLGVSERTEPWAILILGLAATALIVALTVSMRRTEARSHALAVRMTSALRRGERELHAVVDGTTDLIITFAADGRLVLSNRAFRQLLGLDEHTASGVTIGDVIHPAARAAFDRALASVPPGQSTQKIETCFRSREGGAIDVEGALSFIVEDDARVTRAIFRDVSARRAAERALLAANQALERLATTDGLTGVANRRAFDERLAEEIARARRGGASLAIALLDVDCFKLYNDTYGHLAGDECLRHVGASLRAVVRRAGEVVARYGGEEFVLLLPGSTAAAATQLADDVRARVAALALPHSKSPHGMVTVSFGVAVYDDATMTDGQGLVAAADRALYRAKAAGRNRVEVASSSA